MYVADKAVGGHESSVTRFSRTRANTDAGERRAAREGVLEFVRFFKGLAFNSPWLLSKFIIQGSHASWKVLESPGFFFFKIPGPGKSWKITLVLESPGN